MPLTNLTYATFAGLVGYVVLCNCLRFRRRAQKEKQYGYRTREDMAQMTTQHASEIILYLTEMEFPFTMDKSLEFALFKTYGIPSISALLLKTNQLGCIRNAPRRYIDTAVLLREFIQNPPNTKRANSAMARMNWIHGRYKGQISNDDFLYTLGLFALEPGRWVDRYEWRSFSPMEHCAMGTFWKATGDAMNISYAELPSYDSEFKDGLQWLEELEEWCRKYEERNMVPAEQNTLVANVTVDLLLWYVPKALFTFGRHAVSTLMEDRLRKAMRFSPPAPAIESFLLGALAVRKFFLRYLALPRPRFLRPPTIVDAPDENGRYHLLYYPNEPWYVNDSLWNRYGPQAIMARLAGRPSPDRAFGSEGYLIEEVGPKMFVGKGLEEHEKAMGELMARDRAGCPFS